MYNRKRPDEIYKIYLECPKHKPTEQSYNLRSSPIICHYSSDTVKEHVSDSELSPESVIYVMNDFIWDSLKHCLTCGPSIFLQRSNGPKISIDKYVSYRIYFNGKEYSSINELKQLDNECKVNHEDEGYPEDGICEFDMCCGDHIGGFINHLYSVDYEKHNSGFSLKSQTYNLSITFSYDLALFSDDKTHKDVTENTNKKDMTTKLLKIIIKMTDLKKQMDGCLRSFNREDGDNNSIMAGIYLGNYHEKYDRLISEAQPLLSLIPKEDVLEMCRAVERQIEFSYSPFLY